MQINMVNGYMLIYLSMIFPIDFVYLSNSPMPNQCNWIQTKSLFENGASI